MGAIERYERKVTEVESLEREKQRRLGSRDQLLKRLKEEHGCAALNAAKAKQAKLKKEYDALDKEINAALDDLEATYEAKD